MAFPKTDLHIRFKIKYTVNPITGCWDWCACKDKSGYGKILGIDNKVDRAHRISYMLFKGEISEHLEVCHSCDNKSCCNPDHLFLGTHKENMNDARIKGILPPFKHPSRRAYDKGCRCEECKSIVSSARKILYKNKKQVH